MLLVVLAALVSLTPPQQVAVVAEARKALGVPYDLGGRLQRGRGLDCQGLVFFALQPVARGLVPLSVEIRSGDLWDF